jgi:hypothetical protein
LSAVLAIEQVLIPRTSQRPPFLYWPRLRHKIYGCFPNLKSETGLSGLHPNPVIRDRAPAGTKRQILTTLMFATSRSKRQNSFPADLGRNYAIGSVDGHSRGHGLKTTVDHALIRGLDTAGPDASRSCLSLGTSIGSRSGC